jgi:hypothetical protein
MTPRLAWLRSPRFVVPLLAALVTVIVAGAIVLWLTDRAAEEVPVQGDSMTDAQAAAQVVESARQIVGIAQLHGATGGYAFMSCKDKNEPPYQVAFYMNFALPQVDSVKYLHDVAAAMAARGWAAAPATGENFGEKLTRGGVTAIFYGSANDTGVATLRLYGQCRVTADHRNDNPVWTEVTDQLR